MTNSGFDRFQKEQSFLLYYVTYGSTMTRVVRKAMEECDRNFGTHCATLMQTADRILGAGFGRAAAADTSREAQHPTGIVLQP